MALGSGIDESDLLLHDERAEEPALAYLLSRLRYPKFPEPIGVLRCVARPSYENLMEDQIEEARKSRGAGNLEALFNAGDTWQVS